MVDDADGKRFRVSDKINHKGHKEHKEDEDQSKDKRIINVF